MNGKEQIIILCNHCGNVTPHNLATTNTAQLVYEIDEDNHKYIEPFDFFLYSCGACGDASLLGGFRHEIKDKPVMPVLYPTGSKLVPPSHMLASGNPVPKRIIGLYEEVWPLRHKAPNAFAVQIRRALEFVCRDKNAQGRDLATKLRDLSAKGILPMQITNMTDLLRKIGNIGAHASEEDVDIWDAELIDDFFRTIIEYVYIAPAKIERLNQRLGIKSPSPPRTT
jgi:hypothetical protein